MKPAATPTQRTTARERDEAVRALHTIQAARPLRPPPYNFEQARRSAAALALQADKRAGLW